MLPRRYAHFVFAILQSGLTTAVAAAITIARMAPDNPLIDWVCSWAVAWTMMVPVVILAAPTLRKAASFLTRNED
jgi:hypothetical protein